MVEVNRLADSAVNCFFKMHKVLGPGLFQSVYEGVKMKLGLLVNFNSGLIKDSIHRAVNGC